MWDDNKYPTILHIQEHGNTLYGSEWLTFYQSALEGILHLTQQLDPWIYALLEVMRMKQRCRLM